MAQHDGVISNASGAAVRADLNNALAALITNSSGATSPATTYAYQWWADTTTGQLKLRNSSNSAWITIFELDGTMLMEDGTLAAPGLAFASDLDTGFSRSAANKINFSTGGAERLEIGDSEVVFNDPSNDVDFRVESNGQSHMLFVDAGNDRVGVATSSPGTDLDVNNGSANCTIRARTATGFSSFLNLLPNGSGSGVSLAANADSSAQLFNQLNSYLAFGTNNGERMRIDSSGKVGIGLPNPSNQLELANGDTTIRLNATAGGNAFLKFLSNTGNNNYINFGDTDDDDIGSIVYVHSDNSLRFTANASEKMRILSSGGITFNGDTAAANALDDYEQGTFDAFANVAGSFTGESTRTSRYTRIGNMVYCDLRLVWTGTTGTTGLSFDLPFAQAGTTGNASGHTGIVFYEGTSVDASAISTHVSKGASVVSFFRTDGGSGFAAVNLDQVNGTYDWVVSFSYLVA